MPELPVRVDTFSFGGFNDGMLLLAAVVSALFTVSTPPVLSSMSGLGGDDDKKVDVPIVADIWQATVTDSTLTETALDEFSFDGFTHVQGALGAGVVSIRFEDMTKIDFEPGEKGKSVALVSLKSGPVKKITVDAKTNFYGKTGFGNYKVLVKDTRRVVFTAGPIKRADRAAAKNAKPGSP